jgi:hypothetical protein
MERRKLRMLRLMNNAGPLRAFHQGQVEIL